mmetsp:Transcript_3386/g.5478  ORF Transcript_3386/g.5478 Transcript_3386/m.5478 type:complete len:260 (+) Transcript_3386:342-1121(+)
MWPSGPTSLDSGPLSRPGHCMHPRQTLLESNISNLTSTHTYVHTAFGHIIAVASTQAPLPPQPWHCRLLFVYSYFSSPCDGDPRNRHRVSWTKTSVSSPSPNGPWANASFRVYRSSLPRPPPNRSKPCPTTPCHPNPGRRSASSRHPSCLATSCSPTNPSSSRPWPPTRTCSSAGTDRRSSPSSCDASCVPCPSPPRPRRCRSKTPSRPTRRPWPLRPRRIDASPPSRRSPSCARRRSTCPPVEGRGRVGTRGRPGAAR